MALLGKTKNKSAEEKPLTYWQRKDLEKATEAKKRKNIFTSRLSGEEGGTGYETSSSSFVGGRVVSRSRVSFVGGRPKVRVGKSAVESARGRVGFAKGSVESMKIGFAKGGGSNSARGNLLNKPISRPFGLH
jgi:hypothetical protein